MYELTVVSMIITKTFILYYLLLFCIILAFICFLGDPAYLLSPYIIKKFTSSGKNEEEQFFGYRLLSARMIKECAFGRLKAQFGCLRRDMDINLDGLTYVKHSRFLFHDFFETHKKSFNPQYDTVAFIYDSKF